MRVPAKFPNISKADRDANFSIWLSEKKEMYKNRPKTADAPKNIGRGKVIQKRRRSNVAIVIVIFISQFLF